MSARWPADDDDRPTFVDHRRAREVRREIEAGRLADPVLSAGWWLLEVRPGAERRLLCAGAALPAI